MNCVATALVILKAMGIVLLTVPAVAVTDQYGRGFYRPYTAARCVEFRNNQCTKYNPGMSVVFVRDVDDCYALTHELVHHWQLQVMGRMPSTRSDQRGMELEAMRITTQAMSQIDDYGDRQ